MIRLIFGDYVCVRGAEFMLGCGGKTFRGGQVLDTPTTPNIRCACLAFVPQCSINLEKKKRLSEVNTIV